MLIAIILAGSCMPVLSAAADGTSAGNTVDVGIKRVYDKTTETYDESPLVPAGASGSGNSWQIVEGKYNGYGTSQKMESDSNKRGKRFSGVTFDLYKTVNGVTALVKEGIFLSAKNDTDPEITDIWTADVLNMPLYEDGYMVVYTVTETTPLENTDYKKAEDGLTVTMCIRMCRLQVTTRIRPVGLS